MLHMIAFEYVNWHGSQAKHNLNEFVFGLDKHLATIWTVQFVFCSGCFTNGLLKQMVTVCGWECCHVDEEIISILMHDICNLFHNLEAFHSWPDLVLFQPHLHMLHSWKDWTVEHPNNGGDHNWCMKKSGCKFLSWLSIFCLAGLFCFLC